MSKSWHALAMAVATASAVAASSAAPADAVDEVGIPMSQYLAPLLAPTDGRASPAQFPIVSALQPGRLMGQPRWADAQWLTQSLFVIGSDPMSLRWLVLNRQALQKMGASGLLVQVPDNSTLVQVLALAPGISIAPADSAWLGRRLLQFRAAVVPLLIRADGVITQELEL